MHGHIFEVDAQNYNTTTKLCSTCGLSKAYYMATGKVVDCSSKPDVLGSNSTKLLCCEHRRTRQMVWPDNGSAEVCEDCLLTRHHWEQGETEWQNHAYTTVADWYQEAADLQRSMDKM